jgi:glycosyltransferase involved in cell wall biosynthesis
VINVGALAAMMAGVPHVWHIREFLSRPCFLKDQQRDFIRSASNRVIFNSQAVQADTIGSAQWHHASVIYNYVSPPAVSDLQPAKDSQAYLPEQLLKDSRFRQAPKLLVLGAVQPYKRPLDAIRALALLKPKEADPHLLIVGSAKSASPYFRSLHSTARRLGIHDRVHFLGEVPYAYPVIQAADIMLICSDSEPWGRTAVEAALARKPVIGTDAGGLREIVRDGETGLLYPPGDIDALAACIDRLLAVPDTRAALGLKAEAFARQAYGLEHYGGRLADALTAALQEPNPLSGVGAYWLASHRAQRPGQRVIYQLLRAARHLKAFVMSFRPGQALAGMERPKA